MVKKMTSTVANHRLFGIALKFLPRSALSLDSLMGVFKRIKKTLLCTSCTQQSAESSPLKIKQEGETPKCSGIAQRATINPPQTAIFKSFKLILPSILETYAK